MIAGAGIPEMLRDYNRLHASACSYKKAAAVLTHHGRFPLNTYDKFNQLKAQGVTPWPNDY